MNRGTGPPPSATRTPRPPPNRPFPSAAVLDPPNFCRSALIYLREGLSPKNGPHPRTEPLSPARGFRSPLPSLRTRAPKPTCPSLADHPNEAEGRGRVVSDAERSEARGTDRAPRRSQRGIGVTPGPRARGVNRAVASYRPLDNSHDAHEAAASTPRSLVDGRADCRRGALRKNGQSAETTASEPANWT
jgi:hypothetical protein